MKRTTLLNRHVSHLIASLGHLDEIVIADAGLPMPKDVTVIDLAVRAGIPSFWDVLAAVQSEMMIEKGVFATDCTEDLQSKITKILGNWEGGGCAQVVAQTISHEEFKARSASAKAIIRTGECTPYCNIILVSGVPF